MKLYQIFSLSFVSALTWSCGSIDSDATISLPGARDPLDRLTLAASTNTKKSSEMTGDPSGTFKPGDYVEVAAEGAGFYAAYPSAGATPTAALKAGTALVVLNVDSKYMHVQQESGEAGFVANEDVVPQGLLPDGTAGNAEIEVVNWSDIADSEQEAEISQPEPVEEEVQVEESVPASEPVEETLEVSSPEISE